ncbi:unnamed protein product [Lota lota]
MPSLHYSHTSFLDSYYNTPQCTQACFEAPCSHSPASQYPFNKQPANSVQWEEQQVSGSSSMMPHRAQWRGPLLTEALASGCGNSSIARGRRRAGSVAMLWSSGQKE